MFTYRIIVALLLLYIGARYGIPHFYTLVAYACIIGGYLILMAGEKDSREGTKIFAAILGTLLILMGLVYLYPGLLPYQIPLPLFLDP